MTEEFVLHVMPPVRHVMGPALTSVRRARMDPSCLTVLVTRPVPNPIILKRVNVYHATTTARHVEVSSQIGNHGAFIFLKTFMYYDFLLSSWHCCYFIQFLLCWYTYFFKLVLFFVSTWLFLFGWRPVLFMSSLRRLRSKRLHLLPWLPHPWWRYVHWVPLRQVL